ncbi:hypothetical protein HanXRQr2_Chr08g0354981 [Helianthus annuus]|uniref:Uncharacterized protein n=1 Tax=Helianthus annuus TaxID=4232 RepID=A0A9K3IHM7_HELAN|nr:hypothetical protein HanXRQr2_Chr08g0354981 [Helianthus annuus]KAJ0902903.1 hypothetical protein HanPSC8_Chr08g0342751 [Helianthus annuus]
MHAIFQNLHIFQIPTQSSQTKNSNHSTLSLLKLTANTLFLSFQFSKFTSISSRFKFIPSLFQALLKIQR